jgi:predicted metalloprotease
VTSQREIENAVHEAVKAGRLSGDGKVKAKATITVEAAGLTHGTCSTRCEDRLPL